MKSRTRFGITVLSGLLALVLLSKILSTFDFSRTFNFEFAIKQTKNNPQLESIVAKNLNGIEGRFAVYIEELPANNSDGGKVDNSFTLLADPLKYTLNELEFFPAASLYKLVLLAAVLKEVEKGNLALEDQLSGAKSHLVEVFGGVDFGYEDAPEQISYTVDEALTRVGRVSDNFAAIMLTEKLRAIRISEGSSNKLLIEITKELGMKNTDFDTDPIQTTAEDIAIFFKQLYFGQIVSPQVSEKIIGYLNLSQLNDRIPAKLPEEVKVVHKTGELARVRHDAGIVYGERPYLIVLLSKDLKYEDQGIETMANISQEVWEYFNKGASLKFKIGLGESVVNLFL